MLFLRKLIARLFGRRDPVFGRLHFNAYGYWKGIHVVAGEAITLIVFAGIDGPTLRQRAVFEQIRGRTEELLGVALARLQTLKKLGYTSVEELRTGAFVEQISFQPESSPSEWGLQMAVNDKKNVDSAWIASVQFRGDSVSSTDLMRK